MRRYVNVLSPLRFILFTVLLPTTMIAAERAFPQTAAGEKEIKTIPASRLIVSSTEETYFSGSNGLFMPLFRYISANDIAMTTPVEAEIDPGRMYFYLGEDVSDREFQSTENVELIELPERLVASIGVRGGYSERNFEDAKAELENWINGHSEYEPTGDPRGIFWNGPYLPAFLKRFEVHIPVQIRQAKKDGG